MSLFKSKRVGTSGWLLVALTAVLMATSCSEGRLSVVRSGKVKSAVDPSETIFHDPGSAQSSESHGTKTTQNTQAPNAIGAEPNFMIVTQLTAMRRLTEVEILNGVRTALEKKGIEERTIAEVLLPLGQEKIQSDYSTESLTLFAGQSLIDHLQSLADRLAAKGLFRADVPACGVPQWDPLECVTGLESAVVASLFSRAPGTAETLLGPEAQQLLAELPAEEVSTLESLVVQRALLSGEFLYVRNSEQQREVLRRRMEQLLLATLGSRISPSEAGVQAVLQAGDLQTREGFQALAAQLLKTEAAAAQLQRFVTEWLGFSEGHDSASGLNSEARGLLRNDAGRHFRALLLQEKSLNRVLTFTREGKNLITQGGFLVAKSHPSATSPTLRGLGVLRKLLCYDLPPPPQNLKTELPDIAAGQSTRQRYEILQQNPQCAACHKLMDPFGFAFEDQDHMGQERVSERGLPLNTQGMVELADWGTKLEFRDSTDLLTQIEAHPRFSQCFRQHYASFVAGHAAGLTQRDLKPNPTVDPRPLGDVLAQVLTDVIFEGIPQ